MSAYAAPLPPALLADQLVQRRSLATDAAVVLGGVAVVAVLAQVTIPLWPVPVTGQTLGVMLVGAALGARRAAAALTTYLVAGLAGLPVFAGAVGGPAAVATPSFGFIIGFIFAAALIGWLAQRDWDRRPLLALAGFGAASIVPFLIGVPYMAMILGLLGMPNDLGTLLTLGVTPFLLGGAIKWVLAAMLTPLAWRAVRSVEQRRR